MNEQGNSESVSPCEAGNSARLRQDKSLIRVHTSPTESS